MFDKPYVNGKEELFFVYGCHYVTGAKNACKTGFNSIEFITEPVVQTLCQ